MKKNGLIILILFFAGFNSTCDKNKLPAPGLDLIYGDWQLFETSGGFSGGGIENLDESKISISITKNGKYIKYNDGEVEQEENYEVVDGEEIDQIAGVYYLHFNHLFEDTFADNLQIVKLSPDTLYLAELGNDTYSYHYTRK